MRRDAHVLVDYPIYADLLRDREEETDVVEQRARRARKVVTIAGQSLERGLTRRQEVLAVVACRSVAIRYHQRAQLPVEGAAELVHTRASLSLRTLCPCPHPGD